MPDSISIDMRGRNSLFCLGESACSARDVLAILNTSRQVNMAFTTSDRVKDKSPMGVNQLGKSEAFCPPSAVNSPTKANDVALPGIS